jgi:hypothetical protein
MILHILGLLILAFVAFYLFTIYFKSPHKNGYGFRTTAEEIVKDINLNGKVVIITGSNTGLGFENAR